VKRLIAELLKKEEYDFLKKIIGVAARGYTQVGKGKETLYVNTPNRKSGVAFIITKTGDKYHVLSLKRHPGFNITYIANKYDDYNKDALKTIEALFSLAKDHKLVKYFKENLNPKEFTKLLLTKEAFHLDRFNEWFPNLKEIEEKEEESVENFKVVFDDAVKGIAKEKVYEFITKASSYLKKFGLSKILHGKVFVVDKLPGNYIAVYEGNSDVIKVSRRAAKKYSDDMGRNFIHELGHRLWRKGHVNEGKVEDVYKQVKYGMFRDDVKEGDVFRDKYDDRKIEVVKKINKGSYGWCEVKVNDSEKLQQVGIGAFKYMDKIKGTPMRDTQMWIPSPYSIKKNEEEWFCELLAFGLVDNNQIYKNFLKEVIR